MMKTLSISDPRWLHFITTHPNATIFHHPAWIDLLGECYRYKSVALVIMDQKEQIKSGLPLMQINSWLTGHRWVSLPFSDFCQPLVSENVGTEEFPGELLNWWASGNCVKTQIRWPLPEHKAITTGQTYAHHINNLLPDFNQVRRTFKPKVNQFIRQAEKANLSIRQSSEWQDVFTYYKLHLMTRKRQGVPAQSLRYFHLLWHKLISQGLGFVLLVYQNAHPIAGAVFLHWNQGLVYKYGASDPTYWNLRPNHLLFWHAIRWGCEHGYDTLDWGRTDIDHRSLQDFKRSWGSQERKMHYSVLIQGPAARETRSGSNQRILKTIIQHSPTWVCKTIGELLYGHFA